MSLAGLAIVVAMAAQAAAQPAPIVPPTGPIGPCRFSVEALSFEGAPAVQAACLLRHVSKGGVIDSQPAKLPKVLQERVGRPVEISVEALAAHLKATDCGGLVESLSWPVSRARDNAPDAPTARYFVIHDTSTPMLGTRPFPPHMDQDPEVNDIRKYAEGQNAVAHVFNDRRGAITWGHDFATPWRATKLESRIIGVPVKGLFLHVENVMPRRFDPAGPPGNDWIAPRPGLTANQYDRLALLYLVASRRAGVWLIPAFHATLDEDIPDAHDDPQNFDLGAFAGALERRLRAMAAAKP